MESGACLVGERVHAEGAARADVDRLQRVVGLGFQTGTVVGSGAKIYVKIRALLGGLSRKGGLRHHWCDRACRVGLLGRLHRCGLLLGKAAGVGDDVVDRVMRAVRVRQCAGQVLDALLLRLLVEQAGVVGGLGGGAFLALGLQGLVLIVDKQHDVSRGDGKEEHQPQQEHEQH